MKIIFASFDPLSISYQDVPVGNIVGEISICITDVKLRILDLSMGIREIEGAGVYSTAPVMQVMTMTLTEPGEPFLKIQEVAHDLAPHIQKLGEIVREQLGKRALLSGADK